MALNPITEGMTGQDAANTILGNDQQTLAAANTALVQSNASVEKLNEITVHTDQLFNNATMQSGAYNTDGSLVVTDNWIRTPLIPLTSGPTQLTVSGIGTIAAGQGRFYFYGPGGLTNFLSLVPTTGATTTTQTVTIPAGAAYVAMRAGNAVNIGLDPTHSPFANTLMLNYGGAALPFQAFSSGVDGTKIVGMQPELEQVTEDLNSVTLPAPQLFDNATMQSGAYSPSGGGATVSDNWIRTPHVAIKDTHTTISISGAGTIPNTAARFLFYSASGVFISAVMAVAGTTSQTATIPAGAGQVACIVANSVGIGLDPTNSAFAATFMLSYGAPQPYQPYVGETVFLNGEKILNLPVPAAGYPSAFYAYEPTGFTGRPQFMVYTRFKNTPDVYAGFRVVNFYDMSELIYSDQYRIYTAGTYKYNGSSMVDQSLALLIDGENECVYRCDGREDFTGGYHGDETLISVDFYADNIRVDTAAAVPLTACGVFEYRQYSDMHESAATGGIVNPAHPVEAKHVKITSFKDASYTTYNKLTWQAAGIPVALWYHAISCIGKSTGTYVENEYLDRAVMTGSTDNKITRADSRQYFATNVTTGLGAQAISFLQKPVPFISAGVLTNPDLTCVQFVWDRAPDNKLYRRYIPPAAPALNEEWQSTMQVQFYHL